MPTRWAMRSSGRGGSEEDVHMTDTEKKLLQAQHRLEESTGAGSRQGSEKPALAGSFRRVQFWKRCCRRCGQWSWPALEGYLSRKLGKTIKFQMGGLRETGDLPLFSRRAHLLTTPKGSGISCGKRALSEADAAAAAASDNATAPAGAAVIVCADGNSLR